MAPDLQYLLYSVILCFVQMLAAATFANQQVGLTALAGNREGLPELTGAAGRAQRAHRNMIENLVLFAALVLIVIDVNKANADPATTVFVKGARYDKMMESFGGVGVNATSPDELKRAVNAAMDSGKPTLINAVIDPAAGSESGRIGNLNPQSVLKKK